MFIEETASTEAVGENLCLWVEEGVAISMPIKTVGTEGGGLLPTASC